MMGLPGMAFVQPDKIAEGHGKFHFVRLIEGIESQRVLQARYDQRETERVQPRVQELQVVGQSSELSFLLRSHLLELRRDSRSDRHSFNLHCTPFLIVSVPRRESGN